MSYLGSWKVDDLLTFPANTHRFDTGAGTDADAVPDYRVYENETGTPILTGTMALLDSANTAGFYSEQITLSAANGFEKGKCYTIYITATVNSVVATTSKTFQIEAEVDANIVSDKTGYGLAAGAITAAVIATDAIDADAIADNAIDAGAIAANAITSAKIATDAIGAAQIAADAIGASEFSQAAADKVWSTTSRTLSAFGFSVTVGTNNDKAGYSLSAAGVQAIWDALTSALTTVGSIGKLLVDNVNATISSRSSHNAADVWAVATRLLTAGTNIVLAKGVGVTGFNDLSAAQVNAEADTALADYDAPTSAELVSEINAVQADIAALNNLSAAQVNAEVDTALSDINLDHLAGTATGIPAIPAGTYIDQIMDDGTAVYDRTTDSLQAIRDRGDAAWDTATGFSTLTQADVRTAVGLGSANLDTQLGAIDDFLDTEVLAIKAKTDNLPGDPADASDIAASFGSLTTTLATIAGYIDTEVATIKGVTDKLDTTLEVDGLVYRFTTNALEQAPAGGGGGGTGLINFVYGGEWVLNQQNRIDFYLQSSAGAAVAGLGSGYTLTLAKNGAAFAASAGTKAEIGSGWYTYLATAGEANTIGTLAAKVVGAGAVEQNLEYVVKQRTAGAIAFTYTLTSTVTGLPIEGAIVWITTDLAGTNTIWSGVTDAFGVARDSAGGLPYLDPGTYYFFRQHGQFAFTNPDTEVVS